MATGSDTAITIKGSGEGPDQIRRDDSPNENTPLISETQTRTEETRTGETRTQTDNLYKYLNDRAVLKFATSFFYFLCSLTGQYIPSPKLYVQLRYPRAITVLLYTLILPLLALGILLNTGSLVFDIAAISFCPFDKYCGYIYTRILNQTHFNLSVDPPSLNQFDDWQKAVITAATVSGALSYLLMACVLYGRYSCLSTWKFCYSRKSAVSALCSLSKCIEPEHHKELETTDANDLVVNPFLNDQYQADIVSQTENEENRSQTENEESRSQTKKEENRFAHYLSSLTTPKQATLFQLIFWLNLIIYFVSVGLFVRILTRKLSSDVPYLEALDLLGLISQFVSQFSAIISCFIFSKVAYAVSNRCLDFTKCVFRRANIRKFEERNENAETNDWKELKRTFFTENEKANHFMILKEMDRKYTLLVKNSLNPYGTWFAVHWVLYTVTAFMSIAYVADQIIMELYGTESPDIKCHGEHDYDCQLTLSYSIFFALEHCLLFLYPCFRAASVTKARSGMIKAVSKENWEHVPLAEKQAFVAYLKEQNCTFKVSILCANLSFGFNMAYLSIFIGVLGVVMKLSL